VIVFKFSSLPFNFLFDCAHFFNQLSLSRLNLDGRAILPETLFTSLCKSSTSLKLSNARHQSAINPSTSTSTRFFFAPLHDVFVFANKFDV